MSQSQKGTVVAEVKSELSQAEHTANALGVRLAQFTFKVESAFLRSALVEEHVIVMRFASHDLPSAGDLKPLCRRLFRLLLWHLISYLPRFAVWD